MRIAQVAPLGIHPYSGVLTVVVHLAAALARHGHQVELWQLHRWPADETSELVDVLDRAGVTVVPVTPASGRRLGKAALRSLAARPIDVAHLHGVFNPPNVELARHLDVPHVVSPHGGYALESLSFHRYRKTAFKYVAELPMLQRAARAIALTEAERADILRYGVRRPIPVIPNGVDPPPDIPATAELRSDLGLADTDRLAVYVGRLDVRAKRLDALVAAVTQVPGWHLALIGGDFRGGRTQLHKLAASSGGRVSVLEPRRGSALLEALAAADVFALLSRSEGLPMALLEALSVGTPALVSPEVERSTGVAAANVGWVTRPSRAAGALATIGRLDPERRAALRAAARSYAGRFRWEHVADLYTAVYLEVVGSAAA